MSNTERSVSHLENKNSNIYILPNEKMQFFDEESSTNKSSAITLCISSSSFDEYDASLSESIDKIYTRQTCL